MTDFVAVTGWVCDTNTPVGSYANVLVTPFSLVDDTRLPARSYPLLVLVSV